MGYKKTFTASSLVKAATIVGAAALGAASAVCIALSGDKAVKTADEGKVKFPKSVVQKEVSLKSDKQIALEVERELADTQVIIPEEESFSNKIKSIFS